MNPEDWTPQSSPFPSSAYAHSSLHLGKKWQERQGTRTKLSCGEGEICHDDDDDDDDDGDENT